MSAIDTAGAIPHLGAEFHPAVWDAGVLRKTQIPRYGVALMEALQFSGGSRAKLLHQLKETEWRQLLGLCDRSQLTLLIGEICRPALPGWVRERVDHNYLNYCVRFERLKQAMLEIADLLTRRSIDFTLLKGFAHSPDLTPDPRLRAQSDIDLWCSPDQILSARSALLDLGYRAVGRPNGRHLEPMVRETEWEWRGDYFALDLPMPVDLHYKLWDDEMERIPGLRHADFWSRRCSLPVADTILPVLDPADAVAFAALHVMMHLLHGSLRLQRFWELAYVLHTRAVDDQFWLQWQRSQLAPGRRVQTVAFLLAEYWFGCGLPDAVKEEVEGLSADVHLWIRHYGLLPIEALFTPNKHELWLNLCLVESIRDKARICSRRLLPFSAAKSKMGIGDSQEGGKHNNAARILKRAAHHARTLPVSCAHGLRWWWLRQALGREFLTFLFSSALFDFGEFIVFLLYNLYLLDRGFREGFLGQVAAAVTAGTFVAVLPAAALTRRIGLQKMVLLAIAGTVTATTLRAIVVSRPALLGCAFLNGLFMSFWAVSLPPAVAGLTNQRNRALAFSLITSIGIGIGAVAAFIGGRLPALLTNISAASGPVGSKRAALLAGSALAALAAIPAVKLKLPDIEHQAAGKKIYPRSRFVYGFLGAIFVWSVGTAGFNPFFNVFFSRHLHLPVERIGSIFSYAQMAQVFVILLAPAIMKRLGDVRSVAIMQLATAAMLVCLGLISSPVLAVTAYIAYMCFQYMSEPCLFSMLMDGVDPSEQSGASALNFFVISLAGTFAAIAAGGLFVRIGYGPTLSCCAALMVIASGLFYGLLRR